MFAQCLHTGCWIEEETELRGREVRDIEQMENVRHWSVRSLR